MDDACERLREKAERFLLDRDADALVGIRRMGREDTVEFLLEVTKGMGIDISAYPEVRGSAGTVVFPDWVGNAEAIEEFSVSHPDADVLYGQDLCHQVPAVVRHRRQSNQGRSCPGSRT